MAKYDLTKAATEDLYSIWEYTVETWSESQADRYYAILEKAFSVIASAPMETGMPYDAILSGLRGFHVSRHMIFYLIQDNGRVQIVRILHERMDFIRHFGNSLLE